MKKWTKFYLCIIVPLVSGKPCIYKQNPTGIDVRR